MNTKPRVIKSLSIGDTHVRLERRYCDLYDVYLVVEDVSTGKEARKRFEHFSDGTKAWSIAVSGCKGEGDDVELLVGNVESAADIVRADDMEDARRATDDTLT